MICLKHKNMVVLWAFSEGKCRSCGEVVHTHHIPCHVVCEDCSILYKQCQVCGKELSADEIQEIIEDENNG